MRQALILGIRPKEVEGRTLVTTYLEEGNWRLVTQNHKDSELYLICRALDSNFEWGEKKEVLIDGEPLGLKGPMRVSIFVNKAGTEPHLSVYAERMN